MDHIDFDLDTDESSRTEIVILSCAKAALPCRYNRWYRLIYRCVNVGTRGPICEFCFRRALGIPPHARVVPSTFPAYTLSDTDRIVIL